MLSWVVLMPLKWLNLFRTPGHSQKGHIRSVRTSAQKFSWNWLFSFFFWSSTFSLGPMWCCTWQSEIFWKSYFAPKMGKIGQTQGSLNVYESLVFFLSSLLFINLVYNESLYYCNCCMFEQISYLEKFWFLRYGPNCSWSIRIAGFFNQ